MLLVCLAKNARLVGSADEIAVQHRFLQEFVRSVWPRVIHMLVTLRHYSTNECDFHEWTLTRGSRRTLVEVIAYLYLRQEENAMRVINTLEPRRRVSKGKVARNVIDKLSGPRPEDFDLVLKGNEQEKVAAKKRIKSTITLRDGLLFQHVSWIVARLAYPNGYMTSPHVRRADKGFDGFIIEFDARTQGLSRIILCEDKASANPRRLIRDVWRDVESIRRGERDDEILADLTTLLKSVPGVDVEATVDEVFWEEVRGFRVAVATGENIRRTSGDFLDLVAGFKEAAGGSIATRSAGVMAFSDVRTGLESLAAAVVLKVKEICGV